MSNFIEIENIQQIQLKVADITQLRKFFYLGVKQLEISPLSIGQNKLMSSRDLVYMLPRHLFALALHRNNIKAVDIGKVFQKNHATILHSNRQMIYLMKTNNIARKFYKVFDNMIKEYLNSINVVIKVIPRRKKQKARKHAI